MGLGPLKQVIISREAYYASTLKGSLLMGIEPRTVTILTGVAMILLGFLGYVITSSQIGMLVGIAVGVFAPAAMIRYLRRKRLKHLDSQLVMGIQTLASGVQAGLNLVQSMELIVRDGPAPIRDEFAHLLREYEYGLGLEQAMNNASVRIGSGDYKLLFAALLTHRQRGGQLADTLSRIADSIREIQRLESRVETLTAQGRATARAMGAMPMVVLAILYFLVDPKGVNDLFSETSGRILLAIMFTLNAIGFLWIRKIMDIDI